MKTRILLCGLLGASTALLDAASLTQSTFTEVIHDVNVVTIPAKTAAPAKVNELFQSPNLVRTGADSRAELTAPDQTLTRIGANTVFSFEPAGRDINLEQGSILFHSPHGKGGGTIKSGGASAAVLGTTLIVATTPVTSPADKNGFKVIILEGKGRVTLGNGKHRTLKAGQMVFVLPGQGSFSPVLDINLSKLVGGSNLVKGFGTPLPSLALIAAAIQQQQKDIAHGRAQDTGIAADVFGSNRNIPANGYVGIDPNTYQIGILYPVVKSPPPFPGPNIGIVTLPPPPTPPQPPPREPPPPRPGLPP